MASLVEDAPFKEHELIMKIGKGSFSTVYEVSLF